MRRRVAHLVDQGWVQLRHRLRPPRPAAVVEQPPRIAVVTVNFHTTRWLRLLLLTLAEQDRVDLIDRIVVVDNGTADDGGRFLQELRRVPLTAVVRHRGPRTHAHGLRAGLAELTRLDGPRPVSARSNRLLVIDPDVALARPVTLGAVATRLDEEDADLCGELRHGHCPEPEAQASFLFIRRSAYEARGVLPFVHHGTPGWWLHRSLRATGHKIVDFPTYREGYAVHRGRSAVAAAGQHAPRTAYGSVTGDPHFMGVSGAEARWGELEARHEVLLRTGAEADCADRLAAVLAPREGPASP